MYKTIVKADDNLEKKPAKKGWLILGIIVGLIIAVGAYGFSQVNKIPAYQQDVQAKWSQVLNNYQRRADLVPNLVATVKGYASHEQATLQAVVEARAKIGTIQLSGDALTNPEALRVFQESQQQLQGSLSRLMAVAESYPNLKADQNFLTLQSQLEGTENRIAVARRDFILAVQQYNTAILSIPGRWIAAWLYPDAKPMPNFTIDPAAQTAPAVQFN